MGIDDPVQKVDNSLLEFEIQLARRKFCAHCYCKYHSGYNGPGCNKPYETCCKCGSRRLIG